MHGPVQSEKPEEHTSDRVTHLSVETTSSAVVVVPNRERRRMYRLLLVIFFLFSFLSQQTLSVVYIRGPGGCRVYRIAFSSSMSNVVAVAEAIVRGIGSCHATDSAVARSVCHQTRPRFNIRYTAPARSLPALCPMYYEKRKPDTQ